MKIVFGVFAERLRDLMVDVKTRLLAVAEPNDVNLQLGNERCTEFFSMRLQIDDDARAHHAQRVTMQYQLAQLLPAPAVAAAVR